MTPKDILTEGLNQLEIKCSPQQIEKFLQFSDLLLEKNKVMNLTAIKEPEEVVTKHLLDCAYLCKAVDFKHKTLIDVGCGAGFPGMPIKLACPEAKVTLLDSLGKRIIFLQETIETMQLKDIEAIHERAEEAVLNRREAYDVAVSRAVAALNVLSELALPYVKLDGLFIAMKSTSSDEELEQAKRGITVLGGKIEFINDYQIPFTDITHRLVGIRKIRPTPEQYPRRFQKISAKPL